MKNIIENNIPMPVLRQKYNRRVTPALKAMKPGESVLTDAKTSKALVNWLNYNGKRGVRYKDGSSYRVWRSV